MLWLSPARCLGLLGCLDKASLERCLVRGIMDSWPNLLYLTNASPNSHSEEEVDHAIGWNSSAWPSLSV